jgi:hypothetical protein
MSKSLIIGAALGYDYNQLKPWVESIDDTGFDGDKVLIIGNTNSYTIESLTERGFILIDIGDTPKTAPIHVLRFLYIYDFLKKNYLDYDYVITTDVKDVYFQQNPFEFLVQTTMDSNLGYPKLVVGSESIRYKDEAWGNENLHQTFGEYIYNDFKDNVIYNVGVIGGTSEYVKDLCLHLYLGSINRPIPIVDQAVFNVLMATEPYRSNVYFAAQSDSWACHAGTTVDPSKINEFRPNLTEAEPHFKNGIVYTCDWKPFYIVHQYDRVPEWKQHVMDKYDQQDTTKYFIYRT